MYGATPTHAETVAARLARLAAIEGLFAALADGSAARKYGHIRHEHIIAARRPVLLMNNSISKFGKAER